MGSVVLEKIIYLFKANVWNLDFNRIRVLWKFLKRCKYYVLSPYTRSIYQISRDWLNFIIMRVYRHVILYLEIYKYFLLVHMCNNCFPLEEVLCTDFTNEGKFMYHIDAPKVLSTFSISFKMFQLENNLTPALEWMYNFSQNLQKFKIHSLLLKYQYQLFKMFCFRHRCFGLWSYLLIRKALNFLDYFVYWFQFICNKLIFWHWDSNQ